MYTYPEHTFTEFSEYLFWIENVGLRPKFFKDDVGRIYL
jgi:hypothetical protein